jgi:CO dehydrogenase/acetyl-CoA synthase alpha subunit
MYYVSLYPADGLCCSFHFGYCDVRYNTVALCAIQLLSKMMVEKFT